MVRDKFKMPQVVRQKGLIDDTLKVYIESKVIDYIGQMKEKTKSGGRFAALIGKYEEIEETRCLVISGAIECRMKNNVKLDDYFIKQVRGYIKAKANMYFPHLTIVGLLNVNRYDDESENYSVYEAFCSMFNKDYNVLVMHNKFSEEIYYYYDDNARYKKELSNDSNLKDKYEQEKMINNRKNKKESYNYDDYTYDNVKDINKNKNIGKPIIIDDVINELNGYFIYYDDNKEMKKYMVSERLEIIGDDKDDSILNVKSNEYRVKNERGMIRKQKEKTKEKGESIKKRKNNEEVSGMEKSERKESIMLPSLLFVLSVILGIGLLKNIKTVSAMENTISVINQKYDEMSKRMDTQDEVIAQNKIEEEKKKEISNVSKSLDNTISDNSEYSLYEVKTGDSLKSISSSIYGSELNAGNIKEYNKIVDENMIKAGDILKIPALK